MKDNIAKIVTENVIKMMETNGKLPWYKPWNEVTDVMNLTTEKIYNGVNWFLLSANDFIDNRYITKKQAENLGGNIKDGESMKGYPIVFFNYINDKSGKLDKKGNPVKIPFATFYKVYNISQIANLESKSVNNQKVVNPNLDEEKLDKFIADIKNAPTIQHKDVKPHYNPTTDTVVIPNKESFKSLKDYYLVLLHEISHATGSKNRLNRDKKYETLEGQAKEELIAELATCYLSAHLKIDNSDFTENSVAYLSSWLGVIRKQPNFLLDSMTSAKKILIYLVGEEDTTE